MDRNQLEIWRLSGGGYNLYIRSPRYIAAILNATLSGWVISAAVGARDCDIEITYDDEVYHVDSTTFVEKETHNDLIDALNEIFIAIAYLTCASDPQKILLHCASYAENNRINIVVGKQKRGKSALVYQKAESGAQVISDDLLIWQPKFGNFIALGLPIRLRRPVLKINGEPADPENFFAGAQLAYTKKSAYDIAPIGKTFLLDCLWVLGENYQAKRMSLMETPKWLESAHIGSQYVSIKKASL